MKKQKTIWESPKLVFNIGETEDLFTENSPGCDCADSEDLFSIYSLGCDIAESDLISDYSPGCSNINYYRSDNMEVEECTWKGTPLSELYTNIGKFQYPPVKPSENHTVLFKLPLVKGELIKPFPSKAIDVWDKDHVRMPHSLHSLYPVTDTKLRRRWELVQQALSRPILCSQQLEKAILHYNSKYSTRWNFDGLHNFFAETLDDEETDYFFFKVLPRIIQLALSLPHLITGGIPLLRRNKTHSISLSQQQISSLLANAFLCTFPRRNTSNIQSEYNTYPNINFNRLFMPSTSSSLQEKLKCLINYFRRVCTKVPDGVVTYSRHYVPPDQTPAWNKETMYLPKLHVSSSGTIEDEGQGMLQIDFANKFVGGGVLRLGAVQEEIRFVICPELIVARLFTECLDDTEALIVVGVERFSNYRGYAKSFNWVGDCQDKTPCDSFGRRYCTVVAVDAIPFPKASLQYSHSYINRELNKAYTGFCWGASKLHMEMHTMTLDDGCKTSIATGNWGCGAFNGNVYLKALLQLMAAGKTGRDVAYFTFGDVELRDKLMEMHMFLTKKKVTVGHLSNLLCQYDATRKTDLYTYLYRAVNNEKELYTKQEDIHSTSHDRKEKEKHTPFDDLEDTWFINSEDFEAVLENVDDSKSTAKHDQQNETKCKFLDTKSYSVSSDLCVQRQNDSWISLRETKQDFSKSENVNKIESKRSPERQRKGPLKRKISDYFTPSSKS